jgi:hypothetical protein
VVTVGAERRLLVVVRTVATLNRLLDVLALTSGDLRIQTSFTHDAARPSALAGGLAEALRELGAPVVPWGEARGFDLALAASENDHLSELDSPILLMPHGAGHQKYYPGTSIVSGLNPQRLVVGGRVVPTAVALPHADHVARLGALSGRGVVVGDPALGRMRENQFRTGLLRAAFGARRRRLVVVASTFGPESVIGRLPELPEQLVGGLPADEFKIVAVLHPGVWAQHGAWQVRQWLSRARHSGVYVVPPHDGWQAALLAADVVIADHGSLALYATLLGKPVLLAGRDSPVTVPGSAAAVLAAAAPVWDPGMSARDQLAAEPDPGLQARVRGLLVGNTDVASRLRALIYRLLKLDEPGTPAGFEPVGEPATAEVTPPALVVGAEVLADGVRIERHPDLGYGDPHPGRGHRHLVANLRTASLTQVGAAAVGVTGDSPEQTGLPHLAMTAQVTGSATCAIRLPGELLHLRGDTSDFDPLTLASLAHVRLTTSGGVPRRDRLYLGNRAIDVIRETPGSAT